MKSQVGQCWTLSGISTPSYRDCVREEVGASESSKSRSKNSDVSVLGFVALGRGSGQISDSLPHDCPEMMRVDVGGSTICQI